MLRPLVLPQLLAQDVMDFANCPRSLVSYNSDSSIMCNLPNFIMNFSNNTLFLDEVQISYATNIRCVTCIMFSIRCISSYLKAKMHLNNPKYAANVDLNMLLKSMNSPNCPRSLVSYNSDSSIMSNLPNFIMVSPNNCSFLVEVEKPHGSFIKSMSYVVLNPA